MSTRPTAVVAGTISLDLVADSVDAPRARSAVGNSGANIAVRLSAAGWDVEMVSLLGPDEPGRAIVDDLTRWGVGTDGLVARPGYRSPRVFQFLDTTDRGTSSLLLTCPRCHLPRGHLLEVPQWDELPAAVVERARTADLLLIDVASEATVELAARATGRVWFEASLREATPAAMEALARQAHVVKVSDEDVAHYGPALAARGARSEVHIVTEGAQGSRFRVLGGSPAADGWSHVPSALATEPVDTIGAGDAFTAAAAAAFVDGADPATYVREGSVAAATACLHPGARGDMLLPGSTGAAWLHTDVPFQCGRCDDRDETERHRR